MSIAEKLTTVAENVSRTHEVVDAYNANVSENVTKINRRLLGNSYPEGGKTLYEKAVEEGKAAEWTRFWDAYQENGQRVQYAYAFAGRCWNDDTLKPKYTIGAKSDLSMNYMCYDAQNITTIPVPIKPFSWTSYNNTFTQCYNLKEIRFEGVTIGKSISFQHSTSLSEDSITNIINNLLGTVSGQTLTLSSAAVTSAFGSTTSAEWTALIATKSNWTISLV